MNKQGCECINWCRIRWDDSEYPGIITKHHPHCQHYEDSVIDAWKVSCDGVSYITENEDEAIEELKQADECGLEGITLSKITIHREILEQLPEFDGF